MTKDIDPKACCLKLNYMTENRIGHEALTSAGATTADYVGIIPFNNQYGWQSYGWDITTDDGAAAAAVPAEMEIVISKDADFSAVGADLITVCKLDFTEVTALIGVKLEVQAVDILWACKRQATPADLNLYTHIGVMLKAAVQAYVVTSLAGKPTFSNLPLFVQNVTGTLKVETCSGCQ